MKAVWQNAAGEGGDQHGRNGRSRPSFFPQGVGEAGEAFGGAGDGGAQRLFVAPEGDGFSGAGYAGVDELAGEDGSVSVGKDEEDVVEFGALAFVNGHGVDGFVLGQPERVEGAEFALGAGEEDPVVRSGKDVGEIDADVAVEETEVVVVSFYHDGPSGVPAPVSLEEVRFLEDVLDEGVQGRDAEGAFSQGTKDSDAFEAELQAVGELLSIGFGV